MIDLDWESFCGVLMVTIITTIYEIFHTGKKYCAGVSNMLYKNDGSTLGHWVTICNNYANKGIRYLDSFNFEPEICSRKLVHFLSTAYSMCVFMVKCR